VRARGRHDHRSATCHDGHAIGLDLGATAVRAAVIRVDTRDGVSQVVHQLVGGLPLAPGTVVDGAVGDATALTATLKELWKVYDIGCRNVILGVANPQVQVRELQVPDLNPADRARSLSFQAREVIAMPMDQVVLDFAPLGDALDENNNVNGLLVATPREPVLAAVSAVEAAGLKVVRVDLSSFAVLRAVAEQGLTSEAVIDLGAHLTTVVVHQRGVPKVVRTLGRGGEELTRRLAERLELNLQEAEEAKCRDGLVSTGKVGSTLTELMGPLLNDIRTSINYFRTANAGAPIQQVTLTGRAAQLPGLVAAVAQHVGAPTRLAEATDALGQPAKRTGKSDTRWASALSAGLAIGAAA